VVGYSVGLVLLHAVFVRMSRERIPLILQGIPFQLLTAGLVWLVLSGLDFRFVGQGG
jgi:Na+-translocating ferredoxin:NAD+ oxidoreductase RnfA subunit